MERDDASYARHMRASVLTREQCAEHRISTEWQMMGDLMAIRFIHPTGRSVTVRQTETRAYRWLTMQRQGSEATTSIMARPCNIRGYTLAWLLEGRLPWAGGKP